MQIFGLIGFQYDWIKAGRRPNHRVLSGEFQVAGGIHQGFADRDDRRHARGPGAGQNRAQVTSELQSAQMSMGVDE